MNAIVQYKNLLYSIWEFVKTNILEEGELLYIVIKTFLLIGGFYVTR